MNGSPFQKAGVDVGLVVADVAEMARFYESALGLVRGAERTTGWGTMVEMHAADSVVRLLQPPEPPDRSEGRMTAVTGLRYLTLPVTDLAGRLDRAVAAGAVVTLAATSVRDVTFAMVADPEGNVVELLERAGS